LSNGVIDFRRVAIHEIGHLLGLADIDGTNPPAIMDIDVSNIDTLTADDIPGVESLYGIPANQLPQNPVVTNFTSRSGDFNLTATASKTSSGETRRQGTLISGT
jgi:hypothetical protein